jgi:hypothetical protein
MARSYVANAASNRRDNARKGLSESNHGLTIVRIDAQCVFEHGDGSLYVVLARPSVQD